MDASPEPETIVIAACVDDGFVMPLLVCLRTACQALSAAYRVDAYVIGYEISAASKQRMDEGLSGLPIRVTWLTMDLEAVRPFWPGIGSESQITAYYRLYLGEALPAEVTRVIFLDADVVVAGDLGELWQSDFEGNVAQAVPDAYAGLLHRHRLQGLPLAGGGCIGDDAPYFNAGVMLIDLRRWRETNVGAEAAAVLWKHGARLSGRDQDALNCVLHGRWKALAPEWNLHELPHLLFCWESVGRSRAELAEAFRRPKVVHFIGRWKPWLGLRSQAHSELWVAAAREVKGDIARLDWMDWLKARVVEEPHMKLNRVVWRGVIQATMPGQWLRGALWLLVCPWMLVTYPLWQFSLGKGVRGRLRALARRTSGSNASGEMAA